MLTATKEQKGSVLVVNLDGSIEESPPFEQVIGPIPTKEIHIGCKKINRLNSAGVRNWIKYFEGLHLKGITFKFFECSPAIVEQINLIKNFRAGGVIESIYLPYICTGCHAPFVYLARTEDLIKQSTKLPELNCPTCKGVLEFDDLQDEYFVFLAML